MPPYYGARATWWLNSYELPNWGIGLDFNHNKVKADSRPANVDILEFTDGINYVTLNGFYRWQSDWAVTPYVGLGAGSAFRMSNIRRLWSEDLRVPACRGVIAGMAGAISRSTIMSRCSVSIAPPGHGTMRR